MQRHRAVDNSVTNFAFQHIFNVIPPRGRKSVRGPHTVPDRFSLRCPVGGDPPPSVTSPPLTSDSQSISFRSCASVPGKTTHSHGPSILGPPFGNAGLPCQTSFIFSRNPSRGEKSTMLFRLASSHFKLVNPASGAIYPIYRGLQGADALARLKLQAGIYPIIFSLRRYSSFKPVKPAKGVRSDIFPAAKIYLLQFC